MELVSIDYNNHAVYLSSLLVGQLIC